MENEHDRKLITQFGKYWSSSENKSLKIKKKKHSCNCLFLIKSEHENQLLKGNICKKFNKIIICKPCTQLILFELNRFIMIYDKIKYTVSIWSINDTISNLTQQGLIWTHNSLITYITFRLFFKVVTLYCNT